jgi:N4-(beta-N-acetylglucosaminyl)-L-asparaginase
VKTTRRDFLVGGVSAAAGTALAPGKAAASWRKVLPVSRPVAGPVAVASGNGQPAVGRALELLNEGSDPLDAVIAGVNIVEADPDDVTVGYGGLPNADGVVQLDSCCMHGPTHRGGGVAALEGFRHPSKVARLVMEETDHVLLVGQGARRFALEYGFKVHAASQRDHRKQPEPVLPGATASVGHDQLLRGRRQRRLGRCHDDQRVVLQDPRAGR